MVLTIGETRISFVEDYIENSVNPEYVDDGDGNDGDDDDEDDVDPLCRPTQTLSILILLNKVGLPCRVPHRAVHWNLDDSGGGFCYHYQYHHHELHFHQFGVIFVQTN